MNISGLDEATWNLIRKWDLDTIRLMAKMFEPVDEEDEDED